VIDSANGNGQFSKTMISDRRRLKDAPFAELVHTDTELVAARGAYAGKPATQRRAAAQWEYDSAMADDLFAAALHRQGQRDWPKSHLEPGVFALAIDPLFAPALLTVGSLEYQYGRVEGAMECFLTLPSLPQNEPELIEIIEKASRFLLDQRDYRNALRLCQAAAEAGPTVAAYWSCVSYSLGHLGRKEDAISAARWAVELDGRNHVHLTDLGWTLVEDCQYEEARVVLREAIALAPPDYVLARNNLLELEKRMRRQRGAKRRRV
jgi:tetratricopeptide (TPR) repeat protein